MDPERTILESNEFELRRRLEFDSDRSIPFGILTVMSGFWYSLTKRLSLPLDGVEYSSVSLLIFDALLIAWAMFLLWQAHVGWSYKALASAKPLDDHYERLKVWAADEGKGTEGAKTEFAKYLRTSIVENAQHNAETNQRRGKIVLRQKKIMGLGLVVLILSGLVQLYSDITAAPEAAIPKPSFNVEVIF